MGRQPCCNKVGLKRGPWTIKEDHKLVNCILNNGIHCWRTVPKLAGLLRCGKSCRLRWINYLRPDLKRGAFTEDEEDEMIQLHSVLGNRVTFRWSKITSHFSGRTDNEIKNHWNTRIKKKLKLLGVDPLTHEPVPLVVDNEALKAHNLNQTTETTSSNSIEGYVGESSEGQSDNDAGLIVSNETNSLLNNNELICGEVGLDKQQQRPAAKCEEVTDNGYHYHSSSLNVDSNPSIQEDNTPQWFHEAGSILSWDDFDFLDQDIIFLLDDRT
ncbi:hypothetical protein MLD38_022710 [Melastoma candidum]|uniref:Uncharacterized protein n=1 Tax=Melastoma candidum TaxID=119954 RepID=A0ACB9QTB6_9MYRT|nr:hypothetical protein MLD38_022710 [Melastoma candidum]